MVCGTALQSMMTTLKQSGTLEEHLNGKMSFGDVKDLLNLDHYLDVAAEGSMDL